jgi:hypothetical protein
MIPLAPHQQLRPNEQSKPVREGSERYCLCLYVKIGRSFVIRSTFFVMPSRVFLHPRLGQCVHFLKVQEPDFARHSTDKNCPAVWRYSTCFEMKENIVDSEPRDTVPAFNIP